MNPLEDIAEAFSFLEQEHGFLCVTRRYYPSLFGNAVVEYESPVLRVKVVRDRTQYFCAFAVRRDPIEWVDLDTLLHDLGEQRELDDLSSGELLSLEAVAASVRRHFVRLAALFDDRVYAESCARFNEYKRARVRTLFGDRFADQLEARRPTRP